MYSFEGEFRRRPQQSLGGASRAVAREELLKKAQVERNQREEKRRIVQSAITIQSFVRGSFSRQREKRISRAEFDETLKSQNSSDDLLHYQVGKLLHFYNELEDVNRLNFVLQSFLKDSKNIICLCVTQPARWLHKLKQLLLLNVRYLKNCVSPTTNISLSLRFIEVFTANETYLNLNQKCMDLKVDLDVNMASKILENVWDFVVRRNYFAVLRLVLENRVPDSLLSSARPPTPLASTLLDLFCRPLMVNSDKKLYFLQILLQDVFTEEFSPQISCFLLPALSKHENAISVDTLLTAIYRDNLIFSFRATPYLLYTFMYIINKQAYSLTEQQSAEYLICLQSLLQCVPLRKQRSEDCDSDDGEMVVEGNEMQSRVQEEIINMVNDVNHVNMIVSVLEDEKAFNQCVIAICWLCHLLLNHQKVAILNYRLLYTLAFKPAFFRLMWRSVVGITAPSEYGSTPLLQAISLGVFSMSSIQETLMLQLTVFCSLLNRLLSTLHDIEFYDQNSSGIKMMPFSLPEMANISATLKDVCMGLIELAYPDKKSSFNLDSLKGKGWKGADRNFPEVKRLDRLFRAVVSLLRQLYSRDCRQKFCPDGTWVARQYPVFLDRVADMYFADSRGRWSRPFVDPPDSTGEPPEEKRPPPSAVEARQLAVLREFPFAIRFRDRYRLFLSLIVKDKQDNQGELANFQLGPQIRITIRRNFIYEDASTSLSYQSEPNIKMRILVQLVNAVGLDEAGIDGGGVFREFLNELLKNCFDPNRGFFKTTNDRLLYPNPNVQRVVPDFGRHYYFIGRMLGKAIYENMLVELPLAGFFLAKILSRQTSDVDIHHLASLDPVMYRNLLYLKTYDGNVSDLGLDFTVMNSEFGENEVVELIPGGAEIPVTESNRINYIHLMADFKLNRQIKAQCQAFKEGLANVIDMEWLYMFDPNELQVLISGAQTAIDIDDLRNHTTYSGGFSASHPVIRAFWKVVEGFDEMRRRQLLKFVTSCSRGPLLGFRDLSPHFCIQSAGRELRLPTSSTCMNLLKLPEFDSEDLLKVKLIYAMESGAGFELS
ncbi:LOW QUALITY PROTEIN: ubiquitin-protein ligase E3C-like [Uloborus diversus]|uniref:LOW QUALITY PROTEIN: ubiquitin-protein ligase E3C-like n=1 Tax=Uloborus diversus TaxID=327109 RepID=UPI002409FE51|nr:LOW QUALITY PROTEIN: ubiquitin-protein ligase E3C-like [Uloborus diversus]